MSDEEGPADQRNGAYPLSLLLFGVHFVYFPFPVTLQLDVITELQGHLNSDAVEFHVRRGHVLEDLLREARKKAFLP